MGITGIVIALNISYFVGFIVSLAFIKTFTRLLEFKEMHYNAEKNESVELSLNMFSVYFVNLKYSLYNLFHNNFSKNSTKEYSCKSLTGNFHLLRQ
jgi:Na+-driven multidrug efflux pump